MHVWRERGEERLVGGIGGFSVQTVQAWKGPSREQHEERSRLRELRGAPMEDTERTTVGSREHQERVVSQRQRDRELQGGRILMVGFWKSQLGWDRKRPTGFSNMGHWVGLADSKSRLEWVRRRGKKGDIEK